MITRAQKVRLGVFVIVSVALLIAMIGVLAGLRLAEARDEYHTHFDVSVSGLEPGAPVKYHGVRVGVVSSVRNNPDKPSEVIVEMSLDEGTPIKTDTKAVLNLTGITGLKFVELIGGTAESDLLKPGSQILAGESFLDRITGQAEDIATKADLLLTNLNRLTEAENRAVFMGLIDDAGSLVANIDHLVEENRETINDIMRNVRDLSDGLPTAVANVEREAVATLATVRETVASLKGVVNRRKVDAVLDETRRFMATARRKISGAKIDPLIKDIRKLAGNMNGLVEDVRLTVIRSREDLFASLAYLLEGLENFSEFARLIREDPSLLLSGPQAQGRD